MSKEISLDQKNELRQFAELSPEIVDSLRRVTVFVEKIFKNNIPEETNNRLDRLYQEGTIVVSSEKLREKLKRDGTSDHEIKFIPAIYSPRQDKIFFRDTTTEKTKIHEFFHFISSYPKENQLNSFIPGGLKQPNSGNNLLNEATTELLAVGAFDNQDWIDKPKSINLFISKIDLNSLKILEKSALSYETAIDKILEFFIDQNTYLDGALPKLAQSYLLADPNGFFTFLDHRGEVRGISNLSEKLKEKIKELPEFETEAITKSVDHFGKDFLKNKKYGKRLKSHIREFMDIILLKDKSVDLRFMFPEHWSESTIVLPPDEKNSKVKVSVNLNLSNVPFIDEKNSGYNRFFIVPFQANMVWQGIKIKEAKRGNLVDDIECFTHKDMLKLFKKIGGENVGEAITELNRIFGSILSEEEEYRLKLKFRDPITMNSELVKTINEANKDLLRSLGIEP